MRTVINISASALILGSCLVALPAAAAEIFLDASLGNKWVTASHPGGDPVIPFKKDDVLIVRQADSTDDHGFRFTASTQIPMCGGTLPAGTIFCVESPYNRAFSAAGAKNEILRLKAVQDLAADMPFNCVVHGNGMKGTLKKP
jgi:hypothetical protein